jgi:sugar phosphate isomerase/epimerase
MNRRNALGILGAGALVGSTSLVTLSASGCAQQPTLGNATAPTRRVLWAANVRNKPLQERFSAAHEGGFSHMSMFPIDFHNLLKSGETIATIKAKVRASGIKFVACDPFTKWVPRWAMPTGYPEDYRSFVDYDADFMFRMAESLGADTINCVEPFGVKYSNEELINALGEFSEQARKQGLKAAFEFMPISGIPDLKAGWDLVRGVGSSNVGLTFDTWHYYRSNPDLALLETIPAEKFFEVQLADARKAIQGGNLVSDLLQFRLPPGDGDFALTPVIGSLKRKGAWISVGPEVFSKAFDETAALDVGRIAGQSLNRWIS